MFITWLAHALLLRLSCNIVYLPVVPSCVRSYLASWPTSFCLTSGPVSTGEWVPSFLHLEYCRYNIQTIIVVCGIFIRQLSVWCLFNLMSSPAAKRSHCLWRCSGRAQGAAVGTSRCPSGNWWTPPWSSWRHLATRIVRCAYFLASSWDFSLAFLRQECIRVRACNYIKFEIGQNLPPVLKIATHTTQLWVDISDCC